MFDRVPLLEGMNSLTARILGQKPEECTALGVQCGVFHVFGHDLDDMRSQSTSDHKFRV